MIGLLLNSKECDEMKYLIKREMDEILFDLEDHRIDHVVKHAMEERYKVLFSLFKRFAPAKDCMKYMRGKFKNIHKG
ncbi:hypothetical protein [Bacillus sp. 03113]|uniref:hypothetical protein n=1 Tax=Bacillus sp. 03113 TaxID=2578211 RepID=UPI00114463E1|nr:hypothetical protein [Bacillus sp. 03113]